MQGFLSLLICIAIGAALGFHGVGVGWPVWGILALMIPVAFAVHWLVGRLLRIRISN
jgi:hypothetical protein